MGVVVVSHPENLILTPLNFERTLNLKNGVGWQTIACNIFFLFNRNHCSYVRLLFLASSFGSETCRAQQGMCPATHIHRFPFCRRVWTLAQAIMYANIYICVSNRERCRFRHTYSCYDPWFEAVRNPNIWYQKNSNNESNNAFLKMKFKQ